MRIRPRAWLCLWASALLVGCLGPAPLVSPDAGTVEADCNADLFEPNDRLEDATTLPVEDGDVTILDQVLCPGDADWYAVAATRGQVVVVELTFAAPDGDLRLTVLDERGFELLRSDTSADGEFGVVTLERDGPVYIGIDSAQIEDPTKYSLHVEVRGLWCQPDQLEPNESASSAFGLEGNVEFEDLTVCYGEEDWFAVPVGAGQLFTARVSFDAEQTDLKLELYHQREDGSLLPLETTDTLTSPETIVHRASHALDARVRVVPSRGSLAGVYDLRLETTGDICAPDAEEPNDAPQIAGPLPIGATVSDLTLCNGDLDYFVVDLLQGQRLTVDVLSEGEDPRLSAYRLLDGAFLSPQASVDTTGPQETLLFTALDGGTFVVLVSGSDSADASSYTLTATVAGEGCSPDGFEPNNASLSAALLSGDGVPFDATLCAGDIDWFAFDVGDSQLLEIILEFDTALADLHFELLRDLGDGLLESVEEVDTVSGVEHFIEVIEETGRHYLKIEQANPDSQAPYVLTVSRQGEMCEEDVHEPDDASEDAPSLTDGYTADLALCAHDTDWLRFDVARGLLIAATLDWDDGDSSIQADLFKEEPSGALTFSQRVILQHGDTYAHSVIIDTTHFLRLLLNSNTPAVGGLPYSLSVGITGQPCFDDAFEPNDSDGAAAPIAPGLFPGLNVCPGEDDWYEVIGSSGKDVSATVTHSSEDSWAEVRLYSRSEAGLVTFLTRSSGLTQHESTSAHAGATEVMLVRVFRASGATSVDYDLEVAVSP